MKTYSKQLSDLLKKYWHIPVILLFIILIGVWNNYFIENDRSPLVGDSVSHLTFALNIYDHLTTPGKLDDFFRISRLPYPPLIYYYTTAVFLIFGVSLKTALWSSFPFTIIILCSAFGIGSRLGGKVMGIVSMVVVGGSCFVMNNMHIFFIDYPQAALSLLSLYLLLKSEYFSKPLPSYLFGITLGLSLLCKFNAVFIILGPILIMCIYFSMKNRAVMIYCVASMAVLTGISLYFLSGMSGSRSREFYDAAFASDLIILLAAAAVITALPLYLLKRMDSGKTGILFFRQAFRFVASVSISLLVSMPFYLYSRWILFNNFKTHGSQFSILTPSFFFEHLQKNMAMLNTFYPLVLVAFVAGFVLYLIKKEKSWDYLILFSACITGLFLTSAFAPSYERYLVPTALLFVILSLYWFRYAGKLRLAATAFIFAWSMMIVVFPLFIKNPPVKPEEILIPQYRGIVYFEPVLPVQPQSDYWKVYEMAETINNDCLKRFPEKKPSICIATLRSAMFEEDGNSTFGELHGYNNFLYSLVAPTICRYVMSARKGVVKVIPADDTNISGLLDQEPEKPFYLIDCYDGREDRVDEISLTARQSGRGICLVRDYNIGDGKNIDIWVFEAQKK